MKSSPSFVLHVTFISLCFFSHSTLSSQVHVDSLKDVGIGTNDPAGAKMKIQTENESKALHIYQNAPDSVIKYGIYNDVKNTGLGARVGIYNEVRQNGSSSNATTGLSTKVVPAGTGTTIGSYLKVDAGGTGSKYGYYNETIHNSSATGELRGIYNYFEPGGSEEGYGIYNFGKIVNPAQNYIAGIYNYIFQSSTVMDTSIFGIDNVMAPADTTSSHAVYGIRSKISNRGDYSKYGIISQVNRKSTSLAPIYGFYANAESGGGTGNVYGMYSLALTTTNDIGYGVYGRVNGPNASNSFAGYFYGKVYTTATYESSDASLKKNIKGFSSALDMIAHLNPVTYEYKGEEIPGAPTGMQYGFLAQEVQNVIPQLVISVPVPGDIVEENYVQKSGDVESGIEEYTTSLPVGEESTTTRLAMNYNGLTPILVKAMQEQQAEIEEYQGKVDTLQSQINLQNKMIAELKSRLDKVEKSNKN